MHDPAVNALTIILFGLSGGILLYAAGLWIRLSDGRERSDERPAIPVRDFRSAAGATGIALGLLGIALVWFALIRLP